MVDISDYIKFADLLNKETSFYDSSNKPFSDFDMDDQSQGNYAFTVPQGEELKITVLHTGFDKLLSDDISEYQQKLPSSGASIIVR